MFVIYLGLLIQVTRVVSHWLSFDINQHPELKKRFGVLARCVVDVFYLGWTLHSIVYM